MTSTLLEDKFELETSAVSLVLTAFFFPHHHLLTILQALQSSSLQTRTILRVVAHYRERFEREKIPPRRMDINAHFSSQKEMLMHAHYLLDGIETYARMPNKKGKTGRHLGSLQTLLWVAGWYTLAEIMEHNRPDKRKPG